MKRGTALNQLVEAVWTGGNGLGKVGNSITKTEGHEEKPLLSETEGAEADIVAMAL